jgi:hypothetical protein
MEEERIVRAMARIEAAARRIEAASIQLPSAITPSDSDLAEKHERLRREAWAALAELDSLIETIEA